MLAFLHRGTCFLKGLPASPLTLRPSFYTAVGVIFPKRKLGHNPSLIKTHYGFPWNLKKKKKNPNSLSCYPKSKLHNMSLWEDIRKRHPFLWVDGSHTD